MSRVAQDALRGEVAEGRQALADGRWEEARARFDRVAGASAEPVLTAEALEGLGWAGWWLGDQSLTIPSREKAFRLFREAGLVEEAANTAALLAADYREFRSEPNVGRGWLERAHGLLPESSRGPARGMTMLIEADYLLVVDGEPEPAVEICREAVSLGRELTNYDLEAIGLAQLGTALVSLGDVTGGMRSLDGALAIATSEPLEFPFTLGWATCCMISACERVGDFRRATEWCDRALEFVERWGGRQLLGICRSSYGTVLAAHGDWNAAEGELTGAVSDLEEARPGMAPGGFVRLAALRLRQGRLDEAHELIERAGPAGTVVRGEIALAEGDPEAAVDLAQRALRRIPESAHLSRLPAIELLARAACEAGAEELAGDARACLDAAGEVASTPYMKGKICLGRSRLGRLAGDQAGARACLEDAIDCFEEAAAPYDAAVARAELAAVLARLGRTEQAERERTAAREMFATLGAKPDLEACERPLPGPADAEGGEGEADPGELTTRELEVLRLVAQGLSDAEIAERLVLSPHTVHRHVANVRTKLRLSSRAAAVAYASRHGLI